MTKNMSKKKVMKIKYGQIKHRSGQFFYKKMKLRVVSKFYFGEEGGGDGGELGVWL
jgi:hypothetical protein